MFYELQIFCISPYKVSLSTFLKLSESPLRNRSRRCWSRGGLGDSSKCFETGSNELEMIPTSEEVVNSLPTEETRRVREELCGIGLKGKMSIEMKIIVCNKKNLQVLFSPLTTLLGVHILEQRSARWYQKWRTAVTFVPMMGCFLAEGSRQIDRVVSHSRLAFGNLFWSQLVGD